MFKLFSVLALLVLQMPAHGASFDCAKASTKVETLICGDPGLSALDSKLSARYENSPQRRIQISGHFAISSVNGCEKAAIAVRTPPVCEPPIFGVRRNLIGLRPKRKTPRSVKNSVERKMSAEA